MKILFAVPFDFMSFKYGGYHSYLGMLNLATILMEQGHRVELVDFNYLFFNKHIEYQHNDALENFHRMANYIKKQEPEVVCFTVMCNSLHQVLLLSRIIKEKAPGMLVILGGPQASVVPEEILKEYPQIDYIGIGEAENTIAGIMEAIERNQGNQSNQRNHFDGVPGIAYRRGSEIVIHKNTRLVQNLDMLPLPDYRILPYFPKMKISMEITRGCPCQCIYCSTSNFWGNCFRKKSVERVYREIVQIKELLTMQKPFISFVDDNLTVDRPFILDMCAMLKPLGIEWTCCSRIDALDEEMVKEMAGAGCKSLFIGIESGSPRIQKIIRKNLRLDRVAQAVEACAKYNISLFISFIYGFPEEGEDDLALTLKMMVGLMKKGVEVCTIHSLAVLSGTKLFGRHKENLVLRDFYSDITDFSFMELTREYISKRDIFPHFYTLEGTLVDRYPYFDRFVNFMVVSLFKAFPRTVELALSLFGADLLDYYKDFMRIKGEEFAAFFRNEYISDIIRGSSMGHRMITFFTDYVVFKQLYDPRFAMVSHSLGFEKKADNIL